MKFLTSNKMIHQNTNRITSEWIYHILNRIIKYFWLALNRFIKGWIASFFILDPLESIHICTESYQSSWVFGLSYRCLNRFTMLFLAEILHLPPFYIYTHTHFLITPKLLNHSHIFSLGLKNSLFINSSRLNTFTYNHFVH